MSYAPESGLSTAAPVRRPAAVTGAASLMILMAAVGLLNAALGLASMNGIVDRFRAAAIGTDATPSDIDGIVALVRASLIIAAIVGVVVAAVLVVLALGVLGGSHGARISTWVVSGLGLICGCGGLALVVGQRAMTLTPSGNTQVTEDLLRALDDAYPSWWVGLSGGLSAAQALGYLVVALLLATPSANAFFRRPRPVQWPPPTAPSAPPAPMPQPGPPPSAPPSM